MRRPRRSSRHCDGDDGTNSIGGFSFGLHGYGGLSCNGNPCGVLPCACVWVQAMSALCGGGWVESSGGSEAARKDGATMLYQSSGQFAQ